MAKKRMFNNEVLDTDAFLDMPLSAQALYFHLNLRADDDGFVSRPKRVQEYVKASLDDLRILIEKRFLIAFDDGVIVIKHWRMHNTLRKDRYNPTLYQEDFAMLGIKPNDAYTLDGNQMATKWQPLASPDIGIDKDIDKDIDTLSESTKEIIDYLNEKVGSKYRYQSTKTQGLIKARFNEGFTVDDFKTVIDKKVADWKDDPKMCEYLRPETLFSNKFEGYLNKKVVKKKGSFSQRDYDFDELEKQFIDN